MSLQELGSVGVPQALLQARCRCGRCDRWGTQTDHLQRGYPGLRRYQWSLA